MSEQPRKFRAAALLDRDGTLIEEREYLADPDGVELLPEAAEAVRLLNLEGVAAILTTNQSGIPRGYLDEATLHRIHERLVEKLAAEGARLDGIYFAPSLPHSGDPRRKPGVGMYEEAASELGLEGLPVYSVGDRVLDVEFGVNAGGKGIRVLTGHQLKEDLPDKLARMQRDRAEGKMFTAENLMEATHRLLADLSITICREDLAVKAKFGDMYTVARSLDTDRAVENRIVLANGCFDLIHGGHVSYLEGAAALGDTLVVAINSDAGVRRLKGDKRPILPEADRIQLLTSLRCVDHVTIFHHDTADHLMGVIRPTIHAKGTDYKPGTVPEGPTAKKLGLQTMIAGDDKENSSRDIIGTVLERAQAGLL